MVRPAVTSVIHRWRPWSPGGMPTPRSTAAARAPTAPSVAGSMAASAGGGAPSELAAAGKGSTGCGHVERSKGGGRAGEMDEEVEKEDTTT